MLMPSRHNPFRAAFTLIELLVVIAIIAILAVVVVLTLNPSELLKQSRDANRVSDMATLNSALSLYQTDTGSSMGTSSTAYPSLFDPAATSSSPTNCAGVGLPLVPPTFAWSCDSSSTYRSSNNGWIPVNFNGISAGAPFGALPIDPVNSSSSRLFYAYATNGTQFETTASMESQKYKAGGGNDVISGDGGQLASVYEKGTKLGLEPLDYGDSSLVGFWSFEEGTGTVAYDYSGTNATGSWSGTGVHYVTQSKGGSYAAQFASSTADILTTPSTSAPLTSGTIVVWANPSTFNQNGGLAGGASTNESIFLSTPGPTVFYFAGNQFSTSTAALSAGWHQFAITWNGSSFSGYMDGQLQGSGTQSTNLSSKFYIGQINQNPAKDYTGLIDNVRLYSQALTAAQIATLYNSGR